MLPLRRPSAKHSYVRPDMSSPPRDEIRRVCDNLCTYDPLMELCPYATVLLARFDELTSMSGIDVTPTSGDPVAWMVGGDEVGAGSKAGSQEATHWLAFGLHTEEVSARALVDAGVAAVPCLERRGRGLVRPAPAVQPPRGSELA